MICHTWIRFMRVKAASGNASNIINVCMMIIVRRRG